MSPIQAKAQVFLTAFDALSRIEQNAILSGLLHNIRIREDLIDLAIAETRDRQSSRPFKNFMKELRKEQNN
ncbi:MAG: hypothetical protein Q7S07_01785 [Candidatus Omnitrophota bacterium]|nr:hypothetical protein [Candidatus Omnitrophota bacterium]